MTKLDRSSHFQAASLSYSLRYSGGGITPASLAAAGESPRVVRAKLSGRVLAAVLALAALAVALLFPDAAPVMGGLALAAVVWAAVVAGLLMVVPEGERAPRARSRARWTAQLQPGFAPA